MPLGYSRMGRIGGEHGAQIIAMSATLSNASELRSWMSPCETFEMTGRREVPLHEYIVTTYDGTYRSTTGIALQSGGEGGCPPLRLPKGVPDSTVMWKIRSRIEDDAWPRKKCFKPLNGENNIVNFEPELEALAA